MIFTLRRLANDAMSSIARLYAPDGTPLCYVLEPGPRMAHPCIPLGVYPLRLQTQGDKSAAYARTYSSKFGLGWHKGMVLIDDVPGRIGIEFHIGNSIADTLGCLLAGESVLNPPGDGSEHYEVVRSRLAYERVYPVLRDAILAGACSLQIIDAEAGA